MTDREFALAKMKEIEELKRKMLELEAENALKIRKLEAQKEFLSQALALTIIRNDPCRHNSRVTIVERELDTIKSVLMNIERNEANEPILVLEIAHDELF